MVGDARCRDCLLSWRCVLMSSSVSSAAVNQRSHQARKNVDRRAEFHPRIESLRGIAALMVAVFHSIHLLPVDGIPHIYLRTISDVHGAQAITTRLLMVFFNGGAAVSLFFVMSGLVLALSLRRDQRPVSQLAPAFAARRFFRIYPTLAFNVLVYAAAMWIVSCEWRWLYRG